MSVQFVLGRAGAGKTAYCLNSIREALAESSLDGPPLILLVPEQASLQMERAILAVSGCGAVHRAEVLSFKRLAYKILSVTGDGGRQSLSPAAQTMLLRLVLSRRSQDLRYYSGAARFNGFIEKLSATINELIEQSITEGDLATVGNADVDPLRSPRWQDLSLLYSAFLQALGPGRVVAAQHLDLARERLAHSRWLQGCEVWADGFSGFSRQELRLLRALAGRTRRTSLTALIDPDLAGAGDEGLFSRSRRMIEETTEAFTADGLTVLPPLELRASASRFSLSPALSRLEARLSCSTGGFGAEPDADGLGSESAAPASSPLQDAGAALQLIEAVHRRAEVDYVVARIQALVRRAHEPLRYRDIAIIVRQLEPYDDALCHALASRGIPFFLDRRRSTSDHALVGLIRSLIRFARSDYAVGPIRQLLKCGFVEPDDEPADALENYLLATGVTGRARWVAGSWPAPAKERSADRPSSGDSAELRRKLGEPVLQRLDSYRARFVNRVDAWHCAASAPGCSTGAEWAQRLGGILGALGADDVIQRWIQRAIDDGELDLADLHRQVAQEVTAALEDLADTLGEVAIELAELEAILEAAFAQFTVGLAPPMLDEVLVGSIERSRHPEIKAAFVMGCNEGLFPAVESEDLILRDGDREWLRARGVRVSPPRRERVFDEALLFYVAATRASESVTVSYALHDDEGRTLRPSPFVEAFRRAGAPLAVQRVGEASSDRSDWAILTAKDLAAALALEFRARPSSNLDDRSTRTRWNDLYEYVRCAEELRPVLEPALWSLVYSNCALLAEQSLLGLVHEPLTCSVSQLETFAACPFKHFAQYFLGLKERSVAELEEVDVGSIHHAVLEEFVRSLEERQESFAALEPATLLERLGESCRRVAEHMPVLGELSEARDRYLARRLSSRLTRILSEQRRVSALGAFRPRRVEQKFGFADADSWPALKVVTPGGRQVLLRGRIDRIDIAELGDELLGVVVDYKHTRDKRLALDQVYHGLSLQLLAYLLVVAEHGSSLTGRPVAPAGALYVTIAPAYRRLQNPEEARRAPEWQRGAVRGVVDADRLGAFDEALEKGWSTGYALYRKNDGDLGHKNSSDASSGEEFRRLLEHTKKTMGVLADRMLSGEVSVRPYRLGNQSPCSWCPYRGVCRFEFPENGVSRFEGLSRGTVLERLSQAAGESDG